MLFETKSRDWRILKLLRATVCVLLYLIIFFYESVRGWGKDLSPPGQLWGQLRVLFGWYKSGPEVEGDQSPSGAELTNDCGCTSTYLYAVMTLTGTASLSTVLCIYDSLLQVSSYFFFPPCIIQ